MENDPLSQLTQTIRQSHIERLHHPLFDAHEINVWVKRDDLMHPVISGNKWLKLRYLLKDAIEKRASNLISMGGPWSNHLHTLAYVGKQLGIPTIGLIRDPHLPESTPTMQDMQAWGMTIKIIPRKAFRDLTNHYHDYLPDQNSYWIPEGGTHPLALKGVAESIDEIYSFTPDGIHFDKILLPCGTATTMSGLIIGLQQHTLKPGEQLPEVIGYAALKGGDFLVSNIDRLTKTNEEKIKPSGQNKVLWSMQLDYHFGGFGKIPDDLKEFMQTFTRETGLHLDPVYTGKMFAGLFDQIERKQILPDQNLLLIHTGGLQGNRSNML